jgi:F-type H+-transporting ATPase subunit b
VQIDYFTTIAQIINFLILVYLLRRFLYRPILKSMNEREQKIISRLKEAEQKKKDAEQEVESYRKMLQELSDKRQDMNAKAAKEAQILQTDLIEKVRSEVEASRVNWNEAFLRQKESLLADLSRHAGDEIYAIVRRALQDLADEDLEKQIINAFIKRLKNMDASEKEKFKEFYKASGQQITMRSTFEIPEDMRRRILEIVNDQTGVDVKIQYEIAPDLICGVEMSAHDTRIAWSIASYLNALEADLSEALAQRAVEKKQRTDVVDNGNERE